MEDSPLDSAPSPSGAAPARSDAPSGRLGQSGRTGSTRPPSSTPPTTSGGAADPVRPEDAGAYGPFAYLATPNAALYRRIMKALLAEKERFTVHVRPDQIGAALAARGEPVGESVVADACSTNSPPRARRPNAPWPTTTPCRAADRRRRGYHPSGSRGRAAGPPDAAQPA